jgi:competence protein ComEC
MLVMVVIYNLPSLAWKDSDIHVYFLDVGQGDCFIIQQAEHTYMIDGGGERFMSEFQNVGIQVIHPFLLEKKIKKIDCIFISHIHYDHIKGILEILPLVEVGEIVLSKPYEVFSLEHSDAIKDIQNDGADENGKTTSNKEDVDLMKSIFDGGDESLLMNELYLTCSKEDIPISYMKEGDCLVGDNLAFVCLYPSLNQKYSDNENENSLVLMMEVNNLSILFTGDVEEEGERYLASNSLLISTTDIIKVPHHGSNSSSSEEFLSHIEAKFAIVSVGDNLFGHPSDIVAMRYENLNIPLYSTKKYGMIEVIISNDHYQVIPFNGKLVE